MIVIDRAILHILDLNAGSTVLSDAELTLSEGVRQYLVKHIERSLTSQDARAGKFYDDSQFKASMDDYLAEKIDFITFTSNQAKVLEQTLLQADEMKPIDLIICDIHVDDVRKIIILKSLNHQGFMHQIVKNDDGFANEIVDEYAILPGMTQHIDEFAVIDPADDSISVRTKRYTIDGNSIYALTEALLECSQAPSPKETLKTVNKVVQDVAKAYGQDGIEAAAAMKSSIVADLSESDEVDPIEIGSKVFTNTSMREDYEAQMKESGFTEPVHVNQERTVKRLVSHKLKTDTGIELSIPVDYFDNTDYVEFNHDPDGSYSITLKHIQDIQNRN